MTEGGVVDRLPADSNVREWSTPERAYMQQLGLIGRNGKPDAPSGVIEAFLTQCRRTALDPGARQIYAAEMGGKWTVLISIDGFRLIADRTGLYRGKKPTLWCGDDGRWTDVWLSSEPPAAAKVAVLREGFLEPLVAVATYAGYCPRDSKTKELKPVGQWETNPSNQLAKCAEMLALRQAFPNELSGLYGTEEMDQTRQARREVQAVSHAVEVVQEHAAPERKFSRDWIAEASAAKSRDELRPIYQAAGDARELNITVPDDGRTLQQVMWGMRAELPEHSEDVADDEPELETGPVTEAGPVTEWPTVQIPSELSEAEAAEVARFGLDVPEGDA